MGDRAPLRVGILGTAAIADRSLCAPAKAHDARGTPLIEIVGVASRDAARAAARGQALGVPFHSSYEAMLESVTLDAVYVCSEHRLNSTVGLMAARRGVHALIEKPIAMRTEDARALLEGARASGVLVDETRSILHHPWVAAVEPASGPIRDIHITLQFAQMSARARDVGLVWDAGPHAAQLVQRLLGTLEASAWHVVGDRLAFSATCQIGAATVHIRCATGSSVTASLVVTGEEARVSHAQFLRPLVGPMPVNLHVTAVDGTLPTRVIAFERRSYAEAQLAAFVDTVALAPPLRRERLERHLTEAAERTRFLSALDHALQGGRPL